MGGGGVLDNDISKPDYKNFRLVLYEHHIISKTLKSKRKFNIKMLNLHLLGEYR